MSSSLWAIQAARKSRKHDAVPGSSRYITQEMKNNLQISKDGIDAIRESVVQCASGLDSLLERINADASFSSILDEIQVLKLHPKLNAYDDTSSRSHSTLLRSDFLSSDASEAPLKSELNIMLGEKMKILPSSAGSVSKHSSQLPNVDPDTLPNGAGLDQERVQEAQSPIHNEQADAAMKEQTPINTQTIVMQVQNSLGLDQSSPTNEVSEEQSEKAKEINSEEDTNRAPGSFQPSKQAVKLENAEDDAMKNILSNSHTRLSTDEADGQSPNNPVAGNSPVNDRDWPTSSAMSPVIIPHTQQHPVTSPNADLSFIPIAKSVNQNKTGIIHENGSENGLLDINREQLIDTLHSEDDPSAGAEPDNSFQAISTAIRKSFAGKLSVTSNTTKSVSESALGEQQAKIYTADQTSLLQTRVKLEPGVSPPDDTAPKKSKSFYQPSKRSSLFVSLPPREPITFRKSSRHSVKVKQEDIGSLTPRSVKKERQESPQTQIRHDEQESVKSKNLHPESSGNSFTSELISNRIGNHLTRSAMSKSNIPTLFSEKSYFNKTQPSQLSPKNDTSSSSQGNKTEKPKTKSARSTRMTTETGSPVGAEFSSRESHSHETREREASATSKSPIRPRLSVKNKTGNGDKSPIKSHVTSSVSNSRSSMRYSRQADKSSQSNRSGVASEKRSSVDLISRLTNPTSSSAAKAVKPSVSQEMVLKNRFLTTTLNPENPPSFSLAPRVVSPTRDFHKNASESLLPHNNNSRPVKFEKGTSHNEIKQSSKRSVIISLRNDLKHKSEQEPSKSPIKRAKSSSTYMARNIEKGKKLPNIVDTNVAPRKRPMGNAVPLPDAARGKFKREKSKADTNKNIKETQTPIRSTGKHNANFSKSSASPGYGPNMLPDIPSDDEVFKSTKYLKSWAETPAILRHLKERSNLDPINIFGKVPQLRMSEVFSNVSASDEVREASRDS